MANLVTFSDVEFDALTIGATEAGHEAGSVAASWVDLDDDASVRALLAGIEDGDPEVLGRLPWLDVSGEWADGTSEDDVWEAIVAVMGEGPWDVQGLATIDPDQWSDLLDQFRMAHDDAVTDDIETRCRDFLAK